MKVLRAADYRIMPWKNGGGTTSEIAIWPPDAGTDDFLWRVSMARIESGGPFSIFPGVDRSLLILDGEGIVLEVQGRALHLTGRSDPIAFPADLPAKARLIGGAVTDLNVMSRRGQVAHSLTVVDVDSWYELEIGAGQALVFCARGAVRVASATGEVGLAGLDALMLETAPGSVTVSPERPSRVCLVEFRSAPVGAPEV